MSASKKKIYVDDFFLKKAKQEGLRARSFYKLKEMNEKFKLFKPKMRILDLGMAPGSWTEYLLKIDLVHVVGIDLKEVEPFQGYDERFLFVLKDIFELDLSDLGEFDVVLSDMAPNTTGIRDVDSSRSLEMLERVFSICQGNLKGGGSLVCKFLQGVDSKGLEKKLRDHFLEFRIYKPEAVRKNSSEFYFVCKKFKKR